MNVSVTCAKFVSRCPSWNPPHSSTLLSKWTRIRANGVCCFVGRIARGSEKSQVRECLGFCAADSQAKEDWKSAVQKSKHSLTWDFSLPLQIAQVLWLRGSFTWKFYRTANINECPFTFADFVKRNRHCEEFSFSRKEGSHNRRGKTLKTARTVCLSGSDLRSQWMWIAVESRGEPIPPKQDLWTAIPAKEYINLLDTEVSGYSDNRL